MTYRAPQLWNVNPTRVKDAPFLSTFKEKQSHGTVTIAHVGFAKLTLPMKVLCNPHTAKFCSRQ